MVRAVCLRRRADPFQAAHPRPTAHRNSWFLCCNPTTISECAVMRRAPPAGGRNCPCGPLCEWGLVGPVEASHSKSRPQPFIAIKKLSTFHTNTPLTAHGGHHRNVPHNARVASGERRLSSAVRRLLTQHTSDATTIGRQSFLTWRDVAPRYRVLVWALCAIDSAAGPLSVSLPPPTSHQQRAWMGVLLCWRMWSSPRYTEHFLRFASSFSPPHLNFSHERFLRQEGREDERIDGGEYRRQVAVG